MIFRHVDALTVWEMGRGVSWRFQPLVVAEDLWKQILADTEAYFVCSRDREDKVDLSILRTLLLARRTPSSRPVFPFIRASRLSRSE